MFDWVLNALQTRVYKKSVPRSFVKFTGKHLCQSLSFNKVAGLSPATLLKKRLWHGCFPVKFAKFLRTAFSNHRPPPVAASVDFWKFNSLLILPEAAVSRCSYKFRNVHKKTPVLQFYFSKVVGLNFIKKTGVFLWTLWASCELFYSTISGGCLCNAFWSFLQNFGGVLIFEVKPLRNWNFTGNQIHFI